MRIALISDQHIDRSSRWEECQRILAWIANDVRWRGVDAVALGGDLFERRPVPEETDAAAAWLRALAETAEVVGVQGNHDPEHALAVLNKLESRHPITMYERPAVHVLERESGSIACLPWPRRASLLAALGRDVPHDQANAVAGEALRDLLRGLGSQMDERGGARLFLGHCMVRGSRVSTGQPLAPGADFELGLEDLGLVRASAYMLGHIHLGFGDNAWSWNDAPVIYPGSPRRATFGELETKGYAIVTVEGAAARVEYVETPCTPMIHVGAHWTGTALDVDRPADDPALDGAEVRLRVEVSADARDTARSHAETWAAAASIRGAVHVKIEEQVLATSRARAPEVAAAATLADKLRAFWESRAEDLGARAERLTDKATELERRAAA